MNDEARMTNVEGMTKHETASNAGSPSSFVIRHSSFGRGRFLEALTFWIFRLATYLVLAAATYIFLDIGIKGGGRTVFTKTAPFINVAFLSEPPQTLYVNKRRCLREDGA